MHSETKWLISDGIFRDLNLDLPRFFADLVQRSTGTHVGSTQQTARLWLAGSVWAILSPTRETRLPRHLLFRAEGITLDAVTFLGALAAWGGLLEL